MFPTIRRSSSRRPFARRCPSPIPAFHSRNGRLSGNSSWRRPTKRPYGRSVECRPRRIECRSVDAARQRQAFGNDSDWIFDAIRRAMTIAASLPLNVKIVSYGVPSKEILGFIKQVA